MASRDKGATLALPRSLGLLVAATLVPLIGHMPWWILASVAVFLAWRLVGIRWFPFPSRTLKWLIAAMLLMVVYGRFHGIMGERPGTAFFIALMGLKILETEKQRDLVVLVLLTYIALLGGLLYHPGLGMGFFSLGFLVLSFAVLARIVNPRAPFADRLKLSAKLLLQALPFAIVMYLVFPRIGGGFWGRRPETAGRTGISKVLRPGALSDLVPSRKVAMRVLFQGPPPAAMARYFRVYVLSDTNGRTWWPGRTFPPGRTVGRPRRTYTVLLNASGKRALPALDWPLAAPPLDRLESGAILRAPRPIRSLVRYRLTSGARREATLSPRERAAELAVPRDVERRVTTLAHHLARGSYNGAVIANRIFRYFVDHHFVYTLTPPTMGLHPIAHFLFDVRAGYCEDYAAAFAMLMRAAGVPTRIVVGYVGGQYNPYGHDVVVREQDAHAWDEAWIAGRWRRFDPTAIIAPGTIRYGIAAYARALADHGGGRRIGYETGMWASVLRFASRWRDAAITGWDNWVVSYGWRRQERLLARLGWEDADRVSLALAFVGLLVVLGYGLRFYGTRPIALSDPAQALYVRYQARLRRVGLGPRIGEGPVAYAERATRSRPDLAAQIARITAYYVAIRYAGEPQHMGALRRAVWRFFPRGSKD